MFGVVIFLPSESVEISPTLRKGGSSIGRDKGVYLHSDDRGAGEYIVKMQERIMRETFPGLSRAGRGMWPR